jgi:hypothetical protein
MHARVVTQYVAQSRGCIPTMAAVTDTVSQSLTRRSLRTTLVVRTWQSLRSLPPLL